MVRLLLTYGADPTITDETGSTPITLASKPHTKSAYNDALFSSIAQQEYVVFYQKETADGLYVCLTSHRMALMEKLFTAYSDSDVRDNLEKLNTPLHWAVSFDNLDAIHFLVGVLFKIPIRKTSGKIKAQCLSF